MNVSRFTLFLALKNPNHKHNTTCIIKKNFIFWSHLGLFSRLSWNLSSIPTLPLWYSAAGCEAEAAQTHACTTLFSHRRYCIIRLTRRKFSFSIFSLFFTSIFFPHVYAMHTTTTHADDTTGIPYKTNGYASEPDNTNYDSDYALKYHTLDRKRTTTTTSTVTGNQHDEKWVVMMMETFSNFVQCRWIDEHHHSLHDGQKTIENRLVAHRRLLSLFSKSNH